MEWIVVAGIALLLLAALGGWVGVRRRQQSELRDDGGAMHTSGLLPWLWFGSEQGAHGHGGSDPGSDPGPGPDPSPSPDAGSGGGDFGGGFGGGDGGGGGFG